MLILSILLPVLMEGLSIALHAASSARHKTEASNLAQDELSLLTTTGNWSSQPSGNFAPDHPEYSWTCQSTDQEYGVSEVRVTVDWSEQGQPRQMSVSTLTQTNPTLAGDTTNTTTGGG
jgi:hypothetical protein